MTNLKAMIIVGADMANVWKHWTNAESIKAWNIPFDDWHCPTVQNNLTIGGTFNFRMENIEDQEGFNYAGRYVQIIPYKYIESRADDGRKTVVEFESIEDQVKITETYEADEVTPLAIQQKFTDSVLEKFKYYVEENSK